MLWGSALECGETVALRIVGYMALVAVVTAAVWLPMAYSQKFRNRRSALSVLVCVGVALGALRLASLFSPRTTTAEVAAAPTAPPPARPVLPVTTTTPAHPAAPKSAAAAKPAVAKAEAASKSAPSTHLSSIGGDGEVKVTDGLGKAYADDKSGYSIRFPSGWKAYPYEGDPWVLDASDGRHGIIKIGDPANLYKGHSVLCPSAEAKFPRPRFVPVNLA